MMHKLVFWALLVGFLGLFLMGCATFNQTTEWRINESMSIGGGVILKWE